MQATVTTDLDTSDDAVVMAIVRANPQWDVEIGPGGDVRFSPLVGTVGGAKEGEAYQQLVAWAAGAGGRAYPASTGFRMPDKAVLGPDAAWLSPAQVDVVAVRDARKTFWSVCPAVVIEVLGDWSSWPELCEKIDRYERYGAAYAVAIRPDTRETYARGTPPEGLRLDVDRICRAS